MDDFRCGYIALVGRPNVGKSTLLNRILGQKISITSRRPQTTRHRVLGIKSQPAAQLIYVDTPGIHDFSGRAMNRHMNRTASSVLQDVDVVVFLVDGLHWTADDDLVLKKLGQLKSPVILAVNKIDLLGNREELLPRLQALSEKHRFLHIIPISAGKGDNVEELEAAIERLLPQAPPLFPEDQVTDRSVRFLAAELVREKLFRKLGKELPYGLTVEIEQFKSDTNITHIHALIWVERKSQKYIVIGKQGRMLKEVGIEARRDIEALIDGKVNLKLWVKVKEGWADDERALHSLGYTHDD
ncbi:MAG: GTPase Era [Gammaproteobacteria bacterium]|jgi:GTP-binding protein Era|nr:GTPase Era [Gammaproteobacteria bacterium]MDH3887645.1 GTPase Era [Gammaproteobacteria bacterium]MDH3935045.1 GTPase Era [Gammaproteobacteria bacterium]MDH3970706.1 GTPase Era [Gammaproteobacteria bacterium]MDH3985736.1 GTPase Era [Gammaproteobacteria bacterium]